MAASVDVICEWSGVVLHCLGHRHEKTARGDRNALFRHMGEGDADHGGCLKRRTGLQVLLQLVQHRFCALGNAGQMLAHVQ